MEDSTTGAGAEGKPRKRAPQPKLSAMLPFVLGCLSPVPIFMAAMDKVPGERAPRYPVLYEFNKLFKLCGGPLSPRLPPSPAAACARGGPAAGGNAAVVTHDRPCRACRGLVPGDAGCDAHGDQASPGCCDTTARLRPVSQ